jgi:adenine specific DNA methylase Mod
MGAWTLRALEVVGDFRLTRQSTERGIDAAKFPAHNRSRMNQLYYGDNLQVLREHIADESVDLIYLDPPFNSKRDYNLLFKAPSGHDSEAQIEAFEDTWH